MLAWAVVAVPAWAVQFTNSSAEVLVVSHEARLSPNFDGRVRLDMGPYLPDLRTSSGTWLGIDIEMGKTTAGSTVELAQRYASIAAHPEAEQKRIHDEVFDLARNAAIPAAVVGLVPVGMWLLLGRRRRHELLRSRKRDAIAFVVVAGVVTALVVRPWDIAPPRSDGLDVWLPVQTAIVDVQVPDDLLGWEIQGGLITENTRRLLSSLFDTYDKSKVFYRDVVDRVDGVADRLHVPAEDETVAVLVSDRHDNIGMDQVVRAVADAGGATAVLDAGDDTSTGESWEAFSLDSLDAAFKDYDARVAVSGNHDNGTFVNRFLADLGWTHLEGEPVEEFGGVRLTGVDDPRSSGLGNWRDETDLSFADVEKAIADDVCKLDADGERVATLLVHDHNLGDTALERGCVDLVLAGHVHVQTGPTRIEGENGKVGYSYTNGTTGGAAYAIAIGSKLRRTAMFTLVTYRDGRPVGLQPVRVQTTGNIVVADYIPLDLDVPEADEG